MAADHLRHIGAAFTRFVFFFNCHRSFDLKGKLSYLEKRVHPGVNKTRGVKNRSLWGTRIRIYPGQYFDSETGLHYNMWRYYEPGSGRYLREDPIRLSGGINYYLYVDNNPVFNIDQLGLILYGTNDENEKAIIKGYINNIMQNIDYNPRAEKWFMDRQKEYINGVDYFNLFNVDIKEILTAECSGTIVRFGDVRGTGEYDPNTNTITLSPKLKNNNPEWGGNVLIHEFGHFAEFKGGTRPDLRKVGYPWFQNKRPEDGDYGYGAQYSTYGYALGE